MLRFRQSTWFVACLAAALCGCGTDAVEISRNAVAPVPGDLAPRENDARHAPLAILASEKQLAGAEPRPADWFEDVTTRSGVDFTYRNGREAGRLYLIESFGGGTAMVDFDRDGDMDLFFTGGGTISTADPVNIAGRPSALFRNEGG